MSHKDEFDKASIKYAVSMMRGDKSAALKQRNIATDILSKYGEHSAVWMEQRGGLGKVMVSSEDLTKSFSKWLMSPEGMQIHAKLKAKYPEGFEKRVQVDVLTQIEGDPWGPYESDLNKIVNETKEKYSGVIQPVFAGSTVMGIPIVIPGQTMSKNDIIRDALLGMIPSNEEPKQESFISEEDQILREALVGIDQPFSSVCPIPPSEPFEMFRNCLNSLSLSLENPSAILFIIDNPAAITWFLKVKSLQFLKSS